MFETSGGTPMSLHLFFGLRIRPNIGAVGLLEGIAGVRQRPQEIWDTFAGYNHSLKKKYHYVSVLLWERTDRLRAPSLIVGQSSFDLPDNISSLPPRKYVNLLILLHTDRLHHARTIIRDAHKSTRMISSDFGRILQ
jgi:hypothetical protein